MSLTEMFKRLGAPLSNSRWSWGSIREVDGAVFLRVWQDQKRKHNGHDYMMVTHHEKYQDDPENLGHQERLKHIEIIRSGAPCYMIMCIAEDPATSPRKVKRYIKDDIFVGGILMDESGNTWIEISKRMPIESIIKY